MDPSELRADPDGLQPPLSRWGHGWRLAVMLGLSATVWVPVASWQWSVSPWWTGADLALGLVAYVLVHLRRRSPVAVAVTGSFSAAPTG